jgi:plastocyanin
MHLSPPLKRVAQQALSLGAAGLLLLAACSQPPVSAAPVVSTATAIPGPTETAVATTSVQIANFAFAPSAIRVAVGTTVTWTNADIEQHTVTERNRAFDSDVVNGNQTYSFTFTKPGTYQYFCQIHPHMTGRVEVIAR